MLLVKGNVALMKGLKVDGHASRFRFSEHGGHQLAAHPGTLRGRINSEQ